MKNLIEELKSVRNGIKGDQTLVGYNIALGICNKYLSEQKHSHWIKTHVPGDIYNYYMCSKCNGVTLIPSKYCPDCGEKMGEYKND